ncbi:hypothetical protein RhiirA4_483216 [Rhizophagus irregularis]|uniref:Uncharacterized protein n=1 Tax=Rhizophagus irregularis TaxID=588596 RepID=A0A2I1HM77_9GLOM|nr:hypothetical protein RhiirA4_483216 [Rhizophagus irregularis]
MKEDGWSRHETFKHHNYNTPSGNLINLSNNHINEVKNTLIYLIQSRLKLHAKHTGPQTISAPFTESEFVSIFRNNIKRYSICHQTYTCRFGGYDAYNVLTNIFNQENWGRRVFKHGQRPEVILVSGSASSSLIPSTKSNNSLQINPENPEMIIIWKKYEINDEDGNKSEAGWITLKFLVGQFY